MTMDAPDAPVAEIPEGPPPVLRDPGLLPHLKRLSVAGFKSFAEPMEFDFLPGITGIVGPNGCGKSNVVDAIRWVLGEQSPRSLRGNEMLDVIFHGAEGEAALGYAEVTLTFSNCRGSLSPDHDEVAVARRLYRSGESEYFLNQQSCRLKDVRELFLGTGAGMEAYSIVEQGKVDALLTSNTHDRRAVFDEVSGISKYRLRVRQAQAKLERVTQDLARVEDMVKEVDGHLTTIRRQARKAEVYRAKTQRLATLRLAVARHRYAAFAQDLAGNEEALRESAARVEAAAAERERLEADRAKAEAELAGLDARRMALHGEVLTLEGKLALLERERYLGEVRRKELDQSALAQEDRAAASEARLKTLEAERAQAETATDAAREALAKVAQRVQEAAARLSLAQARFEQHRTRSAEQERARLEASRRLEEARARGIVLEDRLAVLGRQEDAAREAVSQADQALRAATGRLAAAKAAREGAQAVLKQVEWDAAAAASALAGAVQAAAKARESFGRLEARGAALQEAEAAIAGEPDGEILREAGVRGVLASLIQAAPEDARMVDAALGEWAHAVVVETWRDAAALFARPDARRPLSLLVLEGMRDRLALPEDSLAARVRCEDALRPLVDILLGQVRIRPAHGLEGAAPTEPLATRGGQYLTPSGIARVAPGGAGSPVSLRAEVAAVSSAREAALVSLHQAEGEARSAETASTAREQALMAARGGLDKAQASESEAQRAWGECDVRARMAQERLAALGTEREALRISKRSAELEVETLGTLPSALETPAATDPASPDELAAALDQARQADAAARLAQAHGEGELARAESAFRELSGGADRAREEGAEALRQSQSARQGSAQLLAEETERERLRKEVEASGARGRASMAALEGEAKEAGQRLRAAAQTLREMGDVLRSLEENHQGFVLRRREVEAKRDSLLQQCRENFGWAETEVAQPPEEALPAAALEEGLAALLKEAEALDEQIRRMGSVNLEALEEEEQLEQRVKGLVTSRDDLRHAGVSLAELIKELDARSEAQFIQVFEEVKANFQELFRRLFGGGRADVILEDPAHVLESGIEIIARPPGREPMPISLLSGGQKALVAVALIFAFFRSRPSPFYILDEVDAPLDESNIDRFLGLLQEFARDSQFLIITHNRRTMRAANTLYGVTMQRPGISTRLSVRFEELHASGLLQPKPS